MPKKAIALALSITAIIFCVTNIDRRASADYNELLQTSETANIELEMPTVDANETNSELKTLSTTTAPATHPEGEYSATMNFSLKRLIVQTNDYNSLAKFDAKITKLLKGFYTLEFSTEEATRNAFLELSSLDTIKSVDPDVEVSLSAISKEQYAWGVENIGADHYTDWLTVSEKTDNIVSSDFQT